MLKRTKPAQFHQSKRMNLFQSKRTKGEETITNDSYVSPGAQVTFSTKNQTKVFAAKGIFLLVLLAIAGTGGYVAFHILQESEQHLASTQFQGTAQKFLDSALAVTLRRRKAAIALATNVANAFPNANTWPNASMPGYEAISASIMNTAASNRTTIGVCTLVTPEQLPSFEDYMYDTAFKTINPHYPNTTGLRDFDGDGVLDRGVHGFDGSFQMYRETDGKVWWNSTKEIICPFTMHTVGPKILMYNAHSFMGLGKAIDEVIDCASKRSSDVAFDLSDCAIITDMYQTYNQNGTSLGPNAFIVQPIYPLHDPGTLVAVSTSGLLWAEIMEDLFTSTVDGVDIVLKTDTQDHTYHVNQGRVLLKGEGDLHDPKYTRRGLKIDLYSPGIFSHTSAKYVLEVYPNSSFYEVYTTSNPRSATAAVVSSIFLTALLFFLYDFFVRQEFQAKQAIIEARRLYVRYVSHEIRTPLNTVVMGLSLLRDEISRYCKGKSGKHNPSSSDEIERLLALTDEVSNNTQSAVNVLNDLLDYDKIERGKLKLELEIVDIWKLVRKTVGEFRVQATAQNIDLTLDMNKERQHDIESSPNESDCIKDVIVVGDPIKLAQCLRNLISNGLKFTPEHGSLTVRSRYIEEATNKYEEIELYSGEKAVVKSAGLLELSVIDSGAGMTEEQTKELFQEGVQFNVNKLQVGHGSGLGLFITKGIISQHKGSLSVTSSGLEKGTTFTVRLPVYFRPDNMPRVEDQTNRSSHVDSQEVCSHRILIVDDSPVNRKLLKRLLERAGHSCDEAENGQIALDLIEAGMKRGDRYDTILLDYEMPVLNGPMAVAQMRKVGVDSLVIGLTGNLMREDVDYFKSMGVNEVLPKPFKMQDLTVVWAENIC